MHLRDEGVAMSHISNHPWTTWRAHAPSAREIDHGEWLGRILGQVVPRREAGTRSPDDDRLDGAPRVGLAEGREELPLAHA